MADPRVPPVAKRIPHTVTRHGRTVDDDWAWLANRDDPDARAYLEAENAYADAWFAERGGLIEQVFGEIKGRTLETDLSVPLRKGDWWYLVRTIEGQSYPIHVRRPSATPTDEQTLLDQNLEAEGHPFFAVGAFDVSPSGRLLAWSADVQGDEVYTMRIRDLASGTDRDDVLERTIYGTAWSRDEEHLFYVVPDHALRAHQVWRHRLGTPQSDDVLVLQEDDERFWVSLELSRSEAVILITLDSHTTGEVWFLPADDPLADPRVIEPRSADHEYTVDHQDDRFVILTNLDAEDFRVVTAPVGSPGRESWTELVAHVPGRRIHSVDAFDGFIVLHEWHDAAPRLRFVFTDGHERVPTFDEEVHAIHLALNPEYSTEGLRYWYESLVTPGSVLEEDVDGRDRRLLKQTPVLGGVDLADYRSARTWATASDGTRFPSTWSGGRARPSTAPPPQWSTGTAPTRSPWRPGSPSRGCRSSTAAWCSRWPTCAAAASSAAAGTSTASSPTRATRSPI
jgi:oligopeptidase B